MNIIQMLSDKAYKNHLKNNPHSSFGRRTDYDKEFAVSIIQECAKVYWNMDNGQMHNDYVKALKEHFNIK